MKDYLLSEKFKKFDIIVIIMTILLGYLSFRYRVPYEKATSRYTEISFGYISKKYNDRYYVIDDGHTRLICFDENEKEIFEIVDPVVVGEYGLYIDDVFVDDESIYLSGSLWNGMLLDGEAIARFDLDGNFIETIAYNDYYSQSLNVNKHRLYGMKTFDGVLYYAECIDNHVVVHRYDGEKDRTYMIMYPDAFNAVSDIVFEKGDIIIMNKRGIIERYDEARNSKLIYETIWDGENDRIPFRMDIFEGRVLFTDLRNSEVVEADTDNKSSKVIYSGCDTQTVTVSDTGKELLLTNSDGLLVLGDQEKSFLVLEKTSNDLRTQYIYLFCSGLFAITTLLLIFRLTLMLRKVSLSMSSRFVLIIVIMVSVVCITISYILINSFRTNYYDKIREQLESTAIIVASAIDEDDLKSINEATDFGSQPYKNIVTSMEKVFPLDIEFYRMAYCNILTLDSSKESGYGVAYLDQSIGVYFPLDEVELDEVNQVYNTKAAVWNDAVLDVSGTYLSVKVPIMNDTRGVIGAVAVGADTFVVENMIADMQRRVLFSIIIILLLIWILATEGIALYTNYVAYKEHEEEYTKKGIMPAHMLRLLVFAVFTAFNLVSSFLPVYILKRCDIFPEASRELIASLPMTVNIFVMGIMSLFCANAVRRFGIKKIFMSATAFSLAGNIMMALVPGYFTMIIGLFLDGIGVGLISNAIYVALTYITDEDVKQNSFTTYNAGSLSGINLGMILGGLLATGIGQNYVFLASAAIWLALLVFGSYMAKNLSDTTTEEVEEFTNEDRVGANKFIRNKVTYSFFALIQNPYIVFNSFVFYLVPIFCENLGFNETIVSVLLMLYSQIAVIAGEKLTDTTNKFFGDYTIYIANFLNVLAVAYFVIDQELSGLIGSLILIGISASFGKPSHQTYFLKQQIVKDYGEDKAMGIYNFSENIGESLGPIVFARLIGASLGTYGIFLGVITAMGGLHYILNRKELSVNE
ncbi:MAG: MFS transporter [Erysipelotrichaceae bacterium]|nr:MFS transporter [Erysipelotrichaceae bacterium]